MAANMEPQGVLPMHIQQAAMAQQLGPFMGVYKTSITKSIAIIVLCTLAAIYFISSAVQSSDLGNNILRLVLVIAALGVGSFFARSVMQVAGRLVYLFQQGLIIEHQGRVQVLPWSQITEVWQDITRHYRNGRHTSTTYLYRLRRADGYLIMLDNNTVGVARLGAAITDGITRELVPRAMYSIMAGQTLTFGQFSVNTQGIGNGHEFIPWQQVQDVKVSRGRVSVKRANKFFNWSSTTVSRIPNFFVFLAVTQQMIRKSGMR